MNKAVSRFSFRRVKMVLDFYRRPALRYLGICAGVILLMAIIAALPAGAVMSGLRSSLTGFVIGFMWYMSPLVFATQGSPEITALLPARGIEKFCAILLFCVIFVPLTIGVCWTVPALMFSDVPSIGSVVMFGLFTMSTNDYPYMTVFWLVQYVTPFVTALWIALASRRRSAMRVVAGIFGVLIALWIGGAIIGVIAVYTIMRYSPTVMEQMTECVNSHEMLSVMNGGSNGLIGVSFIILSVILAGYIALALWQSYRKVAQKQI